MKNVTLIEKATVSNSVIGLLTKPNKYTESGNEYIVAHGLRSHDGEYSWEYGNYFIDIADAVENYKCATDPFHTPKCRFMEIATNAIHTIHEMDETDGLLEFAENWDDDIQNIFDTLGLDADDFFDEYEKEDWDW